MESAQVFVVSGGGTGGHIFPALAVANELRQQAPGARVFYLGKSDGMEKELAERAGLPFFGIPASGFERRLSFKNAAAIWQALCGLGRARRWLKQNHACAVLGTGGFICGPIILAARTLGIPTIIHESNVVPGLTNRWLGRIATRVAVGQRESLTQFPANKTVVTGFPLRPGLNGPARAAACAVFGLDPARRVLFIFPGSLAARSINRAVAEMLPHWARRLPEWQVLWMTGKADFEFAQRVQKQLGLPVVIREFVYEVPEAYAAADIVLARAGAGTLAELSAVGKPSLLVPYPYATGNHQMFNAQLLARAGAAEIITDDRINGDVLLETLKNMIARYDAMRQAAEVVQSAYPKQAAKEITRMLLDMAQKNG
jgi:UDP-N-acetylglucosamine--N-acetylmuramyl-(pentapeptide) pyrophosphoryl-undecaprenol N-acetylglucosamine transferase